MLSESDISVNHYCVTYALGFFASKFGLEKTHALFALSTAFPRANYCKHIKLSI